MVEFHRNSDWLLRRISAVLLVLVLIMAIYAAITFPEVIPVHFNAKGKPDGWGSPATLLILPLLGFGIYYMFSWIMKRPHLVNYPVQPSPENVHHLFALAKRMLSVLLLSISVLFLFIVGSTYLVVYGYAEGLPSWTLIGILLIILGPVIYFISRMLMIRKK